MEQIKRLLKEAQDKMLQADHLTFMTYPQIQEPKLLALIVENINVIMLNCMDALLQYERMYKRIEPTKKDFSSELMILRNHCFRRYGIPDSIGKAIFEVKSLAEKKKSCPVEFRKDDKYVLCRDDFKMDVLNIKNVRGYVSSAKQFLDKSVEVLK